MCTASLKSFILQTGRKFVELTHQHFFVGDLLFIIYRRYCAMDNLFQQSLKKTGKNNFGPFFYMLYTAKYVCVRPYYNAIPGTLLPVYIFDGTLFYRYSTSRVHDWAYYLPGSFTGTCTKR